nr:reverse transcriptase domain-containing protein [Tanacetum cinerariifolium]
GIKSLREDEDNLKEFCQISNLEAMLREFHVLILLFPVYFLFLMYNMDIVQIKWSQLERLQRLLTFKEFHLESNGDHTLFTMVFAGGGRCRRNDSIYWPILPELQRLQVLRHDLQHLKVILRDLLDMHRVLEMKSAQTELPSAFTSYSRKMHQEKVQQEKLKAVKARLNFEEVSQHSESGTPSRRMDLKKRLGSRRVCSMPGSREPRRDRSESPRKKDSERKTVFKRLEKGIFHRLREKGKSMSAYRVYSTDSEKRGRSSRLRETEFASEKHHNKRASSRRMEALSESEGSAEGHWKSKPKRQKSCIEYDLSQPWVCEETEPFTPRIRYFDFPKTRMPSHIKTYDESKDPEDHLKIFQAATKIKRWAMPTWCHMFNFTLTGNARMWFDDLLQESISVDEMMRVTTTFVKGEVAASSRERKNSLPSWKQQEAGQKQNFNKGGFWNQQRLEREQDRTYHRLVHAPKEANRGNAQSRKVVTFDQRTKTKQWERPRKGSKKGNLEQGQAAGNPDGTSMAEGEDDGMEGPMIIEAEMGGHFVHHIYVDGVSSSEILYEHCFNRFRPEIGDDEHSTFTRMNFMVVRSPSPYNEIIGRPGVRRIQAVPSTAHRILKFPVTGGMVTLRSSRIILLECTMVLGLGAQQPVIDQATEEKIQIAIHPESGTNCSNKLYLNRRRPKGVVRSAKAQKRGQSPERNKAINEEVENLVNADIMKEVHYHSWLSNPMMVKKHDGNWRMYVDFKDLNKACPKDGYTLSKIDWKVESLCGCPFKCFLDAYKGYHQIKMAKEDEEKTAFITSQGIFYYSKLSFGLKNARETYQRLVDKAFQKQIGRNLEVYVDNPIIKSCTEQEVIRDIEETFKTLREINMKLNPKKFTFRMREGTFLGGGKQVPIYCVSRALQGSKINYTPMEKLILALILADFIMERPKDDPSDTHLEDEEELKDPWILFTDGSSCIDGYGAGLILTNPEGMELTYALKFRFDATNKEAGYEALIDGLRIAEQMGVNNLQANVDSRLMAYQVIRTYIAKGPGMIKYLEKVGTLTRTFKEFSIKQVPRGENKKADALSKIASTSFSHLSKQVLVEELEEKSIDKKEVLAVVEEEGRTWMSPIHEYLMKEILPKEKRKARTIRRKAGRYAMTNVILCKNSFLEPWLRCVGPLQANYVLREIHEGSCSMHTGPRFVVEKALRSGYYWPTMHADARKLIRECNSYQVHRPVPRNPQQNLTPIASPWSFYKWGIDIAGPFPKGLGKVKFMIAAIDYFTKFGLLGEIISDNEKQFRDNPFKDWCKKLCIRQCFASVKHLEANGLVEKANKSLGEGIKTSNGETSFSLTYGTEAVIPVEIGMPTLRTAEVDMIKNDEALEINLDLLEERREQAANQEAKSKAKMEKYYNARVRNTSFRPGDVVYRNNEASHAKDGGNLEPKWEGPYEVTEALGKGAYKLRDRNGNVLLRT